jgi:peptidoglycan/LPS O-acetylase OafA/YrhL
MLAAHDGQFLWLKTNVSRLIAPTIMLSTTAVVLGRWHLAQGDQQIADMTLAALTCSSALLVSITILGIAVKRIDRVPRLVSYLAAGSFWVYIVHHPILGLVHLDLKWMLPGISPIAKTLVAFIVTSGVCLLTYEGFARRTALGRWLGFSMEFPSSANETGDTISVGDPRSRESAAGQSPLPAPRKAA